MISFRLLSSDSINLLILILISPFVLFVDNKVLGDSENLLYEHRLYLSAAKSKLCKSDSSRFYTVFFEFLLRIGSENYLLSL